MEDEQKRMEVRDSCDLQITGCWVKRLYIEK